MAIVSSDVPTPTEEKLWSASEALATRVVQHLDLAAGNRRSLGELPYDDEDRAWLKAWRMAFSARHIIWFQSPRICEIGGIRTSRSHVLGLVWLAAMVEHVRENARLGRIWPAIRDAHRESVQRRLFNTQKQPINELLEALEFACRRFRLRHAYGREDAQQHYGTILLQMGWTRSSLDRLPYWLAGQIPGTSVQELLDHPEHSSTSFRKAWETLIAYRRGNVDEDTAWRKLTRSPWVPQHWIKECLAYAKERSHLGTQDLPTNRQQRETVVEVSEATSDWLLAPRLVWPEGEDPRFRLDLNVADRLENVEGHGAKVEVVSPSGKTKVLCRPYRDEQGWHRTNETIEAPHEFWQRGEAHLRLIGEDGTLLAEETLLLWEDPDFELFRLNNEGEAIRLVLFDEEGLWRSQVEPDLRSRPALYAVTAGDLSLQVQGGTTPSPLQIGDDTRLWRIFRGWSNLRLIAEVDENPVWELDAPQHIRELPDWARRVEVKVFREDGTPLRGTLGWRERVRAKITGLPDDVEIPSVRIGGKRWVCQEPRCIDFKANENILQQANWGRAGSPVLHIRLSLRRGTTRCTLERRVPLPLEGLFVRDRSNHSWQLWPKEQPLDVRSDVLQEARILVERDEKHEEHGVDDHPALLEGNRVIGRIGQRFRLAAADLAGFGAQLVAHWTLYNRLPDQRERILAESVVDTGVVIRGQLTQTGEASESGAIVNLRLRRYIEPTKQHMIVLLRRSGEFQFLSAEDVVLSTQEQASSAYPYWELILPCRLDELLCLGIGFDGLWLGSWWPEHPNDPLLHELTPTQLRQSLILLRWMKAPILHGLMKQDEATTWYRYLHKLIHDYPAEALSAWLLSDLADVETEPHEAADAGLPVDLRMEQMMEGWRTAVRRFFIDWWPDETKAQEIRETLQKPPFDEERSFPKGLLQLGDNAPHLVWKLYQKSSRPEFAAWRKVTEDEVLNMIELREDDGLADAVGRKLGVDSLFLDGLVRTLREPDPNPTKAANVATALGEPVFRKYVLHELLSSITNAKV